MLNNKEGPAMINEAPVAIPAIKSSVFLSMTLMRHTVMIEDNK